MTNVDKQPVLFGDTPYVRSCSRPHVQGKFIFAGEEKLYIRGATYGAFRPNEDGDEFYRLDLIERDFAAMAANGMTAVRIPHTTPPRVLLDIAHRHGLRVMVGLSAEQYIGYLIDKQDAPDIDELIRAKVRICAGHPALLCYAIGNELPASIVRWLGPRQVENFLRRIYHVVKTEDPDGLVTYVNYPTTEYLQLPFLDLLCFNVYLESQDRLEAYLPRLQNIAGNRPLIMSEIGLDALRNGQETQAEVLDWQVRTTFANGCAGAFIFSWTDEWYRGEAALDDWEFGLTDWDRNPKPALAAVRNAFAEVPFVEDLTWPRISIVVCSYNGGRTIRDCCEGLMKLVYPNFEVIVVDDGSIDDTAAIAEEYNFQLIQTENRGLSNARNTGLAAATGEIVAYIDDDAYPDPDWLTYLAAAFMRSDYVGIGGPNIAPPGDGPIATCVANSPGNPTHILLSDQEAEHIPGCNMAFRKEALEAIGGFDPQFRAAGDDVDLCWRLRQQGWSLGFSPAAVVWHHRRSSVQAYWKQQIGYGEAEAMLEKKWPEKYNSLGHHNWAGRIYDTGLSRLYLFNRQRIYHGTWGNAPFQSVYESAPGTVLSLLLMPEWYLIVAILLIFSLLGTLWWPMFTAVPFLVVAISLPILQATNSALQATYSLKSQSWIEQTTLRGLIVMLHLIQPAARLWGRLRADLTPWRRRWTPDFALPRSQTWRIWSERWQAPEQWIQSFETTLRAQRAVVQSGGDFDHWDLEVRGGLFGSARTCLAVEDHGAGAQLIRFRIWPQFTLSGLLLPALFALLATMAAVDQAWLVTVILGIIALGLAKRAFGDCAAAIALYRHVVNQLGTTEGQWLI